MACILGKTVAIISGGPEAIPGIKVAKSMGLKVVVCDGNPLAPGFQLADEKVLASTYDIIGTITQLRKVEQTRIKIDGALSMAADVPRTVAGVAQALSLPGISVQTAEIASDKLLMKQVLREKQIPVPDFYPVQSLKELKEITKVLSFPFVLKPVDSRGARGVLRITENMDLSWAFAHSIQYSEKKLLIAEEYLKGMQFSTEGILVGASQYPIGFSHRNYEYLEQFSPFIIENGGEQPTNLKPAEKLSIETLALEAGRAIGITTGVVKGDMVLTSTGPKVIEIAPRLSGGWFSSDQIPLSTGINIIKGAIKIALGIPIENSELIPKYHKGVAIRYFFPRQGIIKSILNVEEFEKKSWVHTIRLFVKSGDEIPSITDHTKRAGYVITTGDNQNQAVSLAERVVSEVEFEYLEN